MRFGITGHRILPDPAKWNRVEARMAAFMDSLTKSGDEALSSLAIGADQLFARLAVERELLLHAVLPSEDYESTLLEPEDLLAYRALLRSAHIVTVLPYSVPSSQAFAAAGHFIVDRSDWLVAVWDGKPAKGHGGTGDIVHYAREREARLLIIEAE